MDERQQKAIELMTPLLSVLFRMARNAETPKVDREAFLQLEPPERNVAVPHAEQANFTGDPPPAARDVAALYGAELRNVLIFPANTMMRWHTNSNAPGRRLYFLYNESAGSMFRYLDAETGDIVTEHEPAGWSARFFDIPRDDLFWHAVYADCRRLSLGLMLPEE